jgi:hypothetical protein
LSAYNIQPKRVFNMLLSIVVVLFSAHLLLLWLREAHGMELRALTLLLDLDHEGNIPTLFSVLLFVIAGLQLLAMYRLDRVAGSGRWQWRLLAWVCFFFALDEGSQIHEKCIEAVHRLMGGIPHALLTYAWVVPYGIATALLIFLIGPFLLRLPKRTLTVIVIAGTMYISGALITEMLEGAATVDGGETSTFYLLLNTMEETLEMVGLVIFNYALLDRLAGLQAGFSLRLQQG